MEPSTGSPQNDIGDTTEAEPPAKRPRLQTFESAGHREVGLMRDKYSANNASFVGSASGIHFIRSVYVAVAKHNSNKTNEEGTSPETNIVPGEDDQLSASLSDGLPKTLWQPDEVLANANVTDHQRWPSMEELLDWTQSYFDNWHPIYPFLPAPAMLEYLEFITSNRSLDSNEDRFAHHLVMLRSILSICLGDRRQSIRKRPSRPIPSFLVFESFRHAIESIQEALYRPTSMPSLQAAVSVQLFLVSMLRHNAASRIGGMIVRMAFQLGLHRCPARFSAFTASEVQLRQRLFWSIYCLDRHICQSLGHPLTIRDDDVDVCFPDHEYHGKSGDTTNGSDDRLYLLSLLAKQAEIKGMIMELRNKSILHSQNDAGQAVDINTKLSKWENDYENSLEVLFDTGSALNAFQMLIIKISKHESIIALNRPLLANSKESSTYKSALQICISSSRTTISALYDYLLRLKTPNTHGSADLEQTEAPLCWPPLTWAVWMSAFILLYAAKQDQIPHTVVSRLIERSLEILENLASRGSLWPDACALAIRDLRKQLLEPLAGVGASNSRWTPVRRNSGRLREHEQRIDYSTAWDTLGPESSSSQVGWTNGDTWSTPVSNSQLPANVAPFPEDNIDFFEGFDIPFWMGDDHSMDLLSNWHQ